MAHEIEGYVTCAACSGWVIREIASKTGGACSDCFAGGRGPDLRHLEVVGRGYRIRVPVRKPPKKTISKRKSTTDCVTEKARRAAKSRLAAIFPDLYDTLYAQERVKHGLEPWPIEMVVRRSYDPDLSKTLEFAAVYHALNAHDIETP